MKISSFNPLIVTSNAENTIAVFEALGFEKVHSITVETSDNLFTTNYTLKDANGFCIDIADNPRTPRDLTLIRMNVSDFDEAYEALIAKGFTCPTGRTVDSETNKSAMMVAPSGFAFDLCQHIKK